MSTVKVGNYFPLKKTSLRSFLYPPPHFMKAVKVSCFPFVNDSGNDVVELARTVAADSRVMIGR